MQPSVENSSIQRVLILGAGWTGKQIAAQCLAHQKSVILVDPNVDVLQEAPHWIRKHIEERIREGTWAGGRLDDRDEHRLVLLEDAADAASMEPKIDLVIETVVEQIAVKRRALAKASQCFSHETLIVSNSSYFVPSMLAKYVTQPERYAHFHFHVPIWQTQVVDVVPSSTMPLESVKRLQSFANEIGQRPIVEVRENPGYIFNWLLQSWLKAALQLLDRKIATPEEIDWVWTQVSGMKVGPFGTMDWIGLDVIQQILANGRWVEGGEENAKWMDLLQPLLDQQSLGVKSGRGFFEYGATEVPLNSGNQVEKKPEE